MVITLGPDLETALKEVASRQGLAPEELALKVLRERFLVVAERPIQIVDCGRGPQLSTCRITVQDLVPYFRQDSSYDEIMALMPVLTIEEIQAVQAYVRENNDAVMEQDRRIRERNAERVTPPEIEAIRKRGHAKAMSMVERFAREKARGKNGDHSPR